jgi:hypothetical protein
MGSPVSEWYIDAAMSSRIVGAGPRMRRLGYTGAALHGWRGIAKDNHACAESR